MKLNTLLTLLMVCSLSANAQKVILVKVEIQQKSLKDFISETENLIKLTRKEENCLSFNIHQDMIKPNVFVIHEIFKDRDAFQNHLNQPYVKQWFKNLENRKASELEVTELQNLKQN